MMTEKRKHNCPFFLFEVKREKQKINENKFILIIFPSIGNRNALSVQYKFVFPVR